MPDPQFYTRLTNLGSAALNAAITGGATITLSELALGDGGGASYDPDGSETALRGEVHRAVISSIAPDPQNPAWLIVETIIPPDVGGWWIREAGVFDSNGNLFAIAKYPETYKAVLTDGTASTLTVQVILQVTSTDSIQLVVNPLDGYATQGWVLNAFPWADASQVLDPTLEKHVVDPKGLHIALADVKNDVASHQHELGDVNGLETALNTLEQSISGVNTNVQAVSDAVGSHSHGSSQIDGLDAALAAKADANHTHALPDATTAQRGIVELATQAEFDNGTDNTRAVTPRHIRDMAPDSNLSLFLRNVTGTAPDVILEDRKPTGVNGGSSSTNWAERILNTLVRNQGNIATHVGNLFTLPAGAYYVEGGGTGYNCVGHRSRLVDTDGNILAFGDTKYEAAQSNSRSDIADVIILQATTTLKLETRQGHARATYGLGVGSLGAGLDEIYSRLKIWRLS